MENIKNIMAFVEHAHTLSEEEKELFLLLLRQGEPFDPIFIDELSTAIEREKKILAGEIQKNKSLTEKWKIEKKEAVQEAIPHVEKFLQEYTDICEQEIEEFSLGLSKMETKYDQEIEELMGSSESSQIDDIRRQLLEK